MHYTAHLANSHSTMILFHFEPSQKANHLIFKSPIFLVHFTNDFQSQNTSNFVALVSVVFNLFWTLALVFVPCEIGERVRMEFMKLDFTIGQFSWHLFSQDIQKILPIVINNAQQPVLIEWFGSISCIREVFKKVCLSINIISIYAIDYTRIKCVQYDKIYLCTILGYQSRVFLLYGAS